MIRQHIDIVSEIDLAQGVLVESFGKLLDGLVKVCASIALISLKIHVGSYTSSRVIGAFPSPIKIPGKRFGIGTY